MPDETASATPPAAPPAETARARTAAEGGKPDGTLRAPGEGMSRQARNPMPFVVLILVLCAAGWFLVSWMSESSRIQDCVMSGRKNCTEMDPSLGR